MTSPPAGSEGKSWMGATVPPCGGMARFEMVAYQISLYPDSMDSGKIRLHCETDGEMPGKGEWISLLFWRTVSTRVLPLIYKVHSQYSGSALESHYRTITEESDFFVRLADRINAFLAKRVKS